VIAAPIEHAQQALSVAADVAKPLAQLPASPQPSIHPTETPEGPHHGRAHPVSTPRNHRQPREGIPVPQRDRVTFGTSARQSTTTQNVLRPSQSTRDDRPSPPPAPQRPANVGLDGGSPVPSSAFVFFLIAASAVLLFARPGLGGRVALLSNAPRPVALVLELERPD
jgi:hypothetical protein